MRTARRDHLQQSFLTGELQLGSFPVVDVQRHDVPEDDAAFGVTHGRRTYLNPAVGAVTTAKAILRVERRAVLQRSGPCLEHGRTVIWMDDVGVSPTLQL